MLSETEKEKLVLEIAALTRDYLVQRYSDDFNLEGKCIEGAEIMIYRLKKAGINASQHWGWCLFDHCDGMCGEPCAEHCYVLVHHGRQRWYLDCTASQFNYALAEPQPETLLIKNGRPYWFRPQKPSIKEMEIYAGY